MKPRIKLSRRSFLTSVAGAATGAMLTATGDAHATLQTGCTDRDPAPPRGDPGGRGRNCTNQPPPPPTPPSGCSDSDSGSSADPGGRGRRCTAQQHTGCSDSDSGAGADRGGQGRSCRGGPGGREVGRRERRYEVCWVDHPSRSNDECNIQTYVEWATTYDDGRIVYDTAEADARKAEMQRRGYSARWHRILQDW